MICFGNLMDKTDINKSLSELTYLFVFVWIEVLHWVRCHDSFMPALISHTHLFLHLVQTFQKNYYLFIFLFQLPLQYLHIALRPLFGFLRRRCDKTLFSNAPLILLRGMFSTIFRLTHSQKIMKLVFNLSALILLMFVPRQLFPDKLSFLLMLLSFFFQLFL